MKFWVKVPKTSTLSLLLTGWIGIGTNGPAVVRIAALGGCSAAGDETDQGPLTALSLFSSFSACARQRISRSAAQATEWCK